MSSKTRFFSTMLALVTGAAGSMGCSGIAEKDGGAVSAENAGEIGLHLQIGAFQVNQVTYTLKNGTFSRTATVDVADAATLSFVIADVPAGDGYQLTLSAISTDGASCSGNAGPFQVVARQTAVVGVELACVAARDAGAVLVSGTTNACPTISAVFSDPPNGSTIQLHGNASDSDNRPQPLTLFWTTSSGALSDPTSANPTLSCTTTGLVTLTFSASDGDPSAGCADSFQLVVSCPVAGAVPDSGAVGGPCRVTADCAPGQACFLPFSPGLFCAGAGTCVARTAQSCGGLQGSGCPCLDVTPAQCGAGAEDFCVEKIDPAGGHCFFCGD
jgi:hypothetical protein